MEKVETDASAMMDNKAMLRKIETALSYYDMVRNAQKKYYEKQRDKKKADGVYRGRGRPKKEKVPTVSPSLSVVPSGPTGPIAEGGPMPEVPKCSCSLRFA